MKEYQEISRWRKKRYQRMTREDNLQLLEKKQGHKGDD